MKCFDKKLQVQRVILPNMCISMLQRNDIHKEMRPLFTCMHLYRNRFDISNSGMNLVEIFLLAYNVEQRDVIAQLQRYINVSWIRIKTCSHKQSGLSCSLGANWLIDDGYY